MSFLLGKIVPLISIDLIFKETGKYANWELAREIQVGDYGTVDRGTGAFDKYGNIYEDNLIPDFTDKDKIKQGQPLNRWTVSTGSVREREFSVAPECNVAGAGDVALTGTWEFNVEGGAVLVMHNPQLWMIPNNKLLDRLVNVQAVEGKYIVSEAYMCPAASLYLSNKSDKEFTLKLHGKVDAPVAALATGVPVGVGGYMKYQNRQGKLNHSLHPEEAQVVRGLSRVDLVLFLNVDHFARWETLEDAPWGAMDSDDEDDE
ncbi:hypothetical protein HWV62_11285 [Athelia sp. TMB]|nr:hypothetical protein HWV62_11285 [Athelia sp. TMB]